MPRWLRRLLGGPEPSPDEPGPVELPRKTIYSVGAIRTRKIARLVEALNYYAQPSTYQGGPCGTMPVLIDRGRRARHALASVFDRNGNGNDSEQR